MSGPGGASARATAAPGRPTQLYDVAVLGGAMPGLVAAALLAQRGLRVLHVAPTAAGLYESGGWRMPTAPQLLPSPKLLPIVRETLDELTLGPVIQRALEPVALQLLLPRSRFEPLRERELQRAFGAEAAPIAAALARLAAQVEATAPVAAGAPLLPLTLGERLRRWNHVRANRAILEAPLALDGAGRLEAALLALHRFASLSCDDRPGGFAFARATAPLLHGLHHLPDGGLEAQLVGHVRARRGDALVARVEEVVLERGRFAGLRIGGELWRARSLVAALPAAELAGLLPEGRRRAAVRQVAEPITAVPLRVRSLVVRSAGLPQPLAPLAIATAAGGAVALLQTTPAWRDDGKEEKDARILTVASWAREEEVDALLEELLPFHERWIRHRAAPPIEPAAFRFAAPRQPAFEGLPVRSPVGGILHAGPELLPGLGLEGAFLAGRSVAAAAQAIAGKDRR